MRSDPIPVDDKFRGDRMGVGEQWTDCETKQTKHRKKRKTKNRIAKVSRRRNRNK